MKILKSLMNNLRTLLVMEVIIVEIWIALVSKKECNFKKKKIIKYIEAFQILVEIKIENQLEIYSKMIH